MTSVFVLALPPPVTGQSYINKSVADGYFKCQGERGVVLNIAPDSLSRGFQYHLFRFIRVVNALIRIIFIASKDVFFRRSKLVVYIVYEAGLGVFYNICFVLVARIFGGGLIVHHHTSAHTLRPKKIFIFFSWVCTRNAVHVVLSNHMADDIKRLYPNVRNVLVSSNAIHIDSEGGGGRSFPHGRELVVGYLSNLSVEKGALILFDIFRKLVAKYPIKLRFAGPLCDEPTKLAFEGLMEDCPDDVHYCGAVYGGDKEFFFKSIDFFVFPSVYKNEAQPLVVLEALSYGCPVFCLNAGYVSEIVPGYKFVTESPGLLYSVLCEYIDSWLLSDENYCNDSTEALRFFQALKFDSEIGLARLYSKFSELK